MDQAEARAAERGDLPRQARLRRHATHDAIVLRFPVPVEARVFENPSRDERVCSGAVARQRFDARLRLFHEHCMAESLRSHVTLPSPLLCDRAVCFYFEAESCADLARNGIESTH